MKAATATNASPSTYQRAQELIKKKDFMQAKTLLEQSLAEGPSAGAWHDLGVIHYIGGNKQKAVECFEAAVNVDPEYDQAYVNAAEVFLSDGFVLHALDCYARAVKARPGNLIYREKFLNLARNFRFRIFNPTLKQLFLESMQIPECYTSDAGLGWLGILQTDPGFKALHKAVRQKNYKKFRKAFEGLPNRDSLMDVYFLTGLKRVRIPAFDFERFLTHLRRLLLENLETADWHFNQEDFTALADSLAHCCHYTEYAFCVTEEEESALKALRARVESGGGGEKDVAVLASYVPLGTLKNAASILDKYSESSLRNLVKIQIGDPLERAKVRNTIPRLTKIEDEVSRNVQEQYEESPYPQWITCSSLIYSEENEGSLRNKKARILVAGCGTGKEAIELGLVFPDAEILAVDLSLTSLSYAVQKAREYAVKNVTFKQGDILGLEGSDLYDYIACSGVLHHMKEPLEGWRVLERLLRPGGLMRVALYSELARSHVVAARNVIARKKYRPTPDDVRRFRHDCAKLLRRRDYKGLMEYRDFYALSELRDLVFHVQEHRFDISRIQQSLRQLGLTFQSFFLGASVFSEYRKMFPQDQAMQNLDNWVLFEKKRPKTFVSMYMFWCRKPG